MENYQELTKSELIEVLLKQEEEAKELECTLTWLESKFAKKNSVKETKADIVYKMLQKERLTVSIIAERLGTNNRNVSSILCGIKKKYNVGIATDSFGRKFFDVL